MTVLAVDSTGLVDPQEVRGALRPETVLVSVMHANNEIGTLQAIDEIARLTRDAGVLFHVDATQSLGREPIDATGWGIDLLSLSAHKIYGPKGCGALYIRPGNPRVRLSAQLTGGGQERGWRSGTLNTPGIVGLGRACELAEASRDEEQQRIRALRDRLESGLRNRIDDVDLNGHPARRLAGNLNLTFRWVEAESLLGSLRGIALSSGSACSSTTLEPSHVLKAIGLDDDRAQCSIRFGLGRFNTQDEVDVVVDRVATEVARLRKLSPGWAASRQRAAGAA